MTWKLIVTSEKHSDDRKVGGNIPKSPKSSGERGGSGPMAGRDIFVEKTLAMSNQSEE